MRLDRIKQFGRSIAIFLAVLGPGIITANVDNDSGGITTYSLCGAHFGYKMLWVLLLITISLVVIQEMSARMGVVTKKGLADLIREEFGIKSAFFIFLALLVTNLGNTMSEFAGVAASCEIFGINKYISVPIAAVVVWWLVIKGSNKFIEKVFLAACTVYLAYLGSGFLAKPDWASVLKHTLVPSFSLKSDFIVMFIGLVGTSIAPWMQFYQQSAVVEKNIALKDYKYSRLDVIIGCAAMYIVAMFIVIACGATLFKHGVQIETAKDAALALKPLAGEYCSILFAIGLLNASLFSAIILPLSTSYYICEAFGFEAGIDRKYSEAPHFYILYTSMIVIGAGLILIPNINLIMIMLFSQVANGILLPFTLIYMLIILSLIHI